MKIEEYKFGMFRIDGKDYLDDIKIIGNKVRFWQNREFHFLKPENIKELVDPKPEYIVIGTGASGMLNVLPETKDMIYKNRIRFVAEPTEKACNTFNDLVKQNKKVNAILHATC